MLTLRPYQEEAVEAVYAHLRARKDNPCVVIPTAGGKTPLLARICDDAVTHWESRVCVVSHVKELVEQSVQKLQATSPMLPVGIYSAALRRRELGYAVTVASIQSVYERAPDMGPLNLIIVDEAHLIPLDGDGMYRRFIADAKVVNPRVRVLGLTATPYRLKGGPICGPGNILNHICYEIGVRDLIAQGFLCPLRSKAGRSRADMADVHQRGGEFVAGEMEKAFDTDALVESAVAEIVQETADRRSVLIFAAGVKHGTHIVDVFRRRGIECGWVDGDTPGLDRDRTIERFRRGELKYLANINVLTTGFDAPAIDCVAMLRATMSPGLYYQMVGRGFRLSPTKKDCLVLDFGGNVMRHGPVDAIEIHKRKPGARQPGHGQGLKECPMCREFVPGFDRVCPACGHEFPRPEIDAWKPRHDATASTAGVLSGQKTTDVLAVDKVGYRLHRKSPARDPEGTAPPTLRVDYIATSGACVSEWICVEHMPGSFARMNAEAWWEQRCALPCPSTVEDAIALIRDGALREPVEITVERKAGDRFDRVVAARFETQLQLADGCSDAPPAPAAGDEPHIEEGIPF